MRNLKGIYSIFIFSIIICTIFGVIYQSPKTIVIHLPETLSLKFYNEGNQTINFEAEFNIYWLMIGGETNREYKHFNLKDETLLNYMMDIWDSTLNATDLRLHPEFYLNNKELILEFNYNWNSFGIEAFDLSIINDTTYCKSLDFGNNEFISINSLNNEIYLREIKCYKITGTDYYVPQLIIENNNVIIVEKLAWNNKIDSNLNFH